ncbi:MAG: CARDB domain-containing protein, partial [Candidatus Thalassarchaeaceae archaeon]|nr:CARDB domain-containing protein [Candidatus Thalassarchaeaceae archaeon]
VVANAFEIRCRINDMLIGSSNIDTLLPGEMKIVTCDTRIESSGLINLKAIVDVTASIDETNENNNEFSKNIESLAKNNGDSGDKSNNIFRAMVIASIALIAISIVTLQFGPGRIVKPYRKRK